MQDSDKLTGVVDCSVGTIVWVRRRNGSWWPGKILGPEELSAVHLMSPRSGTPVKLLGREDASVDWYNLEKSKRVKAFRCGEFDDCIERAESSQGMPPKKREKYARREDAILHALELEKQLLEKKYGKSGYSCNGNSSKSSDAIKEEPLASLECSNYGNGKRVNKSHSTKLDSSLEDKSLNHPPYRKKVKEGSQLPGTEDISEATQRMRGLQDIGPRISPPRQKLSSSVTSSGSHKPKGENYAHALPCNRCSTENTDQANSNFLDKKRKAYDVLTDESLVKRRDRRRPLVQVLQSSRNLPVGNSFHHGNGDVPAHLTGESQTGVVHYARRNSGVSVLGESSDCSDDKQICSNQMAISPNHFDESKCPHPAALNEDSTSESTESTETDSSETDSSDSDADEEMLQLSVTELEPKCLELSGARFQYGNINIGEPDDLVSASKMSYSHDPVSSDMGVSKWKLKGKRNNRGLAKRSIDPRGRVSSGSMYGINHEDRDIDGCDELIIKSLTTRRRAFDNRGCLLTSKATSKDLDDMTLNMIDWGELAWTDQPLPRGYWEDSSHYLDHPVVGHQSFGGRMKSMLIDVDLKVQSSYQREHVPMISLMSKLNGQAIVGHPLQVEALENGSSEIFLSAADGINPETLDNDTPLTPMWRTARRTANFRVPRSHPSVTLDAEETAQQCQYVDQDKKMLTKKSSMRSFGHKAGMMKRPQTDRKFSRTLPKMISLSSNQKTKTVCSISQEEDLGSDFEQGSNKVDGLIKRESGPTVVACIPVKLVFSRLSEELVGRHQ
ncbi:uncharacterized protein At1g51745-like [Diospyros lotus]|uniref:uncharacterized protein At1g51745-like n=1 Tax=Diospyros lotus TaxID=55363 RepID=UPI0022591514|nr:uncharacterized protein At1g51745-like [Diospyros lotus]